MSPGHTSIRAAAVLALAALLPPAAADAQKIPGVDESQATHFEKVRAEYRASALEDVNEVVRAWTDAWRDDDAHELAEHYAPGARIRGLSFGFVASRDAVEEHFASFLPSVGDVRFNMREFNASGRLAYGVGDFRFRRSAGGADGASEAGRASAGTVMTVFLKKGGWKILSQLFVPGAGS